jgi:hypothetical protein
MIMNIRTSILSIAVLTLLASCSTNQDLVQLDEYDDLYYTPADRAFASEAYSASEFLGANSAESSYYGESPYVDETEKPSADFNDKSNLDQDSSDYYDPDYAARIENFGGDNDPNYIYSDAFANNMNPRFSGNISMNSFNGMNGFGFGIGLGMGNPWMGNRWCDPYFDPFCNCNQWGRPRFGMNPGFGMNMGWGNTWGMYDPFSPWYNPYMAYNPYAWGNPYGFNPYGGGVVVVDGGGSTRGFQNTARNSNSRNSRGGAVGTTSGRRRVVTQGDDGPKSSSAATTRGQRASSTDASNSRTRPVTTAADTDYYNRANSRQNSPADRVNPSTRNRAVNDNTRSTSQRQVTSPYTRQRERQTSTQQTTDFSRYNRSNSGNSSNSTRSRSNNSYSSPTRTTRTSPSTTPSRSRSSYSSPGTSSPSRSTGGGSRRR